MYFRPHSIAEAVDALAAGSGRLLAGGTDFFPGLGDGPASGRVVDLSAVAELRGITVTGTDIRIGAGTTWREVIATPLPRCFDALKQAAHELGSVQIQTVATVAGNLCTASPAADGVPPLLALDAEVELVSRAGNRRLALADFLLGYRRTALRPDELLAAIIVPPSIEGRSVFCKLGARRYMVISIAMVVAIVEVDPAGRVRQARCAVGACSAVAQRLPALEAALVGAPAVPGLGALVRADHLASLAPIDDVRATAAYRRDAASVLLRRALDDCVAAA